MPVNITLAPLSELLTKFFFPNDAHIDSKRQILNAVILNYVPKMPDDHIHFGDAIKLYWQVQNAYLLGSFLPLMTNLLLEDPKLPHIVEWEIRNPSNLNDRNVVKIGDQVIVYNRMLNAYLDFNGIGGNPAFPSVTNTNPTAFDTRWEIRSGIDSVISPSRKGEEVIDGDLIALMPIGANGCLLTATSKDKPVMWVPSPMVTKNSQWQIKRIK